MKKSGPLVLSFATIDVFTNEKFSGNPLAIISLPTTAGLDQEQRQVIAKEFNLSESVFVSPQAKGDGNVWTLNIHTVNEELPFAGHPVIGTACYLLGNLANEDEEIVKGAFDTPGGRIELEYDVVRNISRAAIPHNVHTHSTSFTRNELEKLQPSIGVLPETSPVVSIVRGMAFALIELDTQDALTFVNTTPYPIQMDLDKDWEAAFIGSYFYYRLSSQDGKSVQVHTRMIEGSLEDAATGSAACTLATYLSLKEVKPGGRMRYEIVQGVEMGRRSEISVDVSLDGDGKVGSVHLSGSALKVMDGKLYL